MTKRRYDKNTDLSRSTTGGDTRRLKLQRKRPRLGKGPFSGAFEALQPDSAEHPVDLIVDRIPLVASLTRELLRRAERIKREVKDRPAFIEYEDLRLHIRTEREVAYYNLGHKAGQVVGRLQSLATHDSASRSFVRDVRGAVAGSGLASYRVGMVLLELGRAYLIGRRTTASSGRDLGRPRR